MVAWSWELAVQIVKRVRSEIYFEGTTAWGLGEGRPDGEVSLSLLGCWVREKDEESSRYRKRKEHSRQYF